MQQTVEQQREHEINSKEYWDQRFLENGEGTPGEAQSAYFYNLLLASLPLEVTQFFKTYCRNLHDWGCANGSGTAALQKALPYLACSGSDFSEVAIARAKARFSKITFSTTPLEELGTYDVVICSNTLQHFSFPWEQAAALAKHAREKVILLVPFAESEGRMGKGHVSRFTWRTIAPTIAGFELTYARAIETDEQHWIGSQLLLIYTRSESITPAVTLLRSSLWENIARALPSDEVLATLAALSGSGAVQVNPFFKYLAGHSRFFEQLLRNGQNVATSASDWPDTILNAKAQALAATEKRLRAKEGEIASLHRHIHLLDADRNAAHQRLFAVLNSTRFKIGQNICEFGRHAKALHLREAGRYVWRSLRGTVRRSQPLLAAASGNAMPSTASIKQLAGSATFGIECRCVKDLVSVVLPVYNHRKFLANAIASVLNQRYKNIELILVNDGSTEDIESVIAQFKDDPRVLYVKHVVNQKLPNALNTGFAHARGEFLTWTSADNEMREDALEVLVEFLKKRIDLDMVFTPFELIDHEGLPIKSWTGHPGSRVVWDNEVKLLNTTFNFVGACFLYRNIAARLVGRYSSVFLGAEDYDYWMRINDLLDIALYPDHEFAPYRYRFHHDSLTGQAREMRLEQLVTRVKRVDAVRRRICSSAIDVTVLGAKRDKPHQFSEVLEKQQRSCSHPYSQLQGVIIEIGEGADSLEVLEHARTLRTLQRAVGLHIRCQTFFPSIFEHLGEFDFILVDEPTLLRRFEHPRAFAIKSLTESAAFVLTMLRAILCERVSELFIQRSIALSYELEHRAQPSVSFHQTEVP